MFLTTILIGVIAISNGARILVYVPTPSFSHQVVFQPLWRELSLRGHQVTVVTTNPINDPSLINLTEIDTHFSYDVMNKNIMTIINSSANIVKSMMLFSELFHNISCEQMEHPEVQKLINDPNHKFDVFILELLIPPQIGFAKHFNCPLIGLSSLEAMESINNIIGVPTHPILYPDVLLPFEKAETLTQRIISVSYFVYVKLLFLYHQHEYNAAIEKYFGKGIGTIDKLMANVSLFLTNSNQNLDRPRPMVPGVIQVGGIHRVPPKPLPKDLRSLLDSANKGFIYFSLGSNVKSKDISQKTRQVFLDTFSEIPYTVLWKFELDDLPNKSDNIIISKWFPQTDILKHPNIKLFITQGGLQSMEEAIYESVPMIGIPYFADQHGNVERMVRKGFGLSIDVATVEKETFKSTVMEVITNQRYRNRIMEISQLALDQAMTPLDRAVWWIEYVIRHKGASHLRSPLPDIPWYQYLLLDVIACMSVAIMLCIFAIMVVAKLVLKFIRKVLVFGRKRKLE